MCEVFNWSLTTHLSSQNATQFGSINKEVARHSNIYVWGVGLCPIGGLGPGRNPVND